MQFHSRHSPLQCMRQYRVSDHCKLGDTSQFHQTCHGNDPSWPCATFKLCQTNWFSHLTYPRQTASVAALITDVEFVLSLILKISLFIFFLEEYGLFKILVRICTCNHTPMPQNNLYYLSAQVACSHPDHHKRYFVFLIFCVFKLAIFTSHSFLILITFSRLLLLQQRGMLFSPIMSVTAVLSASFCWLKCFFYILY